MTTTPASSKLVSVGLSRHTAQGERTATITLRLTADPGAETPVPPADLQEQLLHHAQQALEDGASPASTPERAEPPAPVESKPDSSHVNRPRGRRGSV